jgi:hypothetical protein
MVRLYAPSSYWVSSEEWRSEVGHGCGSGKFGDRLVPDSLLWLSIYSACSIHDWMYASGVVEADRDCADRVFRNNMVRLVGGGSRWLRWPRLQLVRLYYGAVHHFGGPAFWRGKNKPSEMG